MSVKQDRVYTRTAAQLKQEMNFGESFAEVMGIATDARKAAELAQDAAENPSAKLTQDEIFNLLTDRTLLLSARIDKLLRRFEINSSMIYANDTHWQTVYRNLERLDPQWDTALNQWVASVEVVPAWEETASEQLIAYFLYRHLADAAFDGRLKERIAFALLSAHVIEAIATSAGNDLACLIDTARAYSAEVEYNEEAVEQLIGELAFSH